MLNIIAAKNIYEECSKWIHENPEYQDEIKIFDEAAIHPDESISGHIYLSQEGIKVQPMWFLDFPPLLFPAHIPYQECYVKAVLAALMYNFQLAVELTEHDIDFQNHIKLLYAFAVNMEITAEDFTGDTAEIIFNKAISLHYGLLLHSDARSAAEKEYLAAIEKMENAERKAFIIKNLATFWLDQYQQEEAQMLLFKAQELPLSKGAKIALRNEQYAIILSQVNDKSPIRTLKNIEKEIADCLAYYTQEQLFSREGLTLMDAAVIAQVQKNFSEGLSYLHKASKIFETQELEVFGSMAELQKGKLLLQWAQTGQNQFYRESLKAFQAALKIYTQENAPDMYAEIQHQMGIVYAEIMDDEQKRGIWAAKSIASFQEALAFFTKEEFPYPYALICNHQGNAYTKYPQGKNMDNFEKALSWYAHALEIRTAEEYPQERVLTLFNALEACWNAGSRSESLNEERKQAMKTYIEEILTLTEDAEMLTLAQAHLEKLTALAEIAQ